MDPEADIAVLSHLWLNSLTRRSPEDYWSREPVANLHLSMIIVSHIPPDLYSSQMTSGVWDMAFLFFFFFLRKKAKGENLEFNFLFHTLSISLFSASSLLSLPKCQSLLIPGFSGDSVVQTGLFLKLFSLIWGILASWTPNSTCFPISKYYGYFSSFIFLFFVKNSFAVVFMGTRKDQRYI